VRVMQVHGILLGFAVRSRARGEKKVGSRTCLPVVFKRQIDTDGCIVPPHVYVPDFNDKITLNMIGLCSTFLSFYL